MAGLVAADVRAAIIQFFIQIVEYGGRSEIGRYL